MATAKRPGRGKAPRDWTYTVGDVPHRLTAFERADKGRAIYTRVWDGKRYRDKRPLCGPIRDARGKVDPEREVEAQRAAITRQGALAAGLQDAARPSGPVTLRAGFAYLLHPKEGKYAGNSRHRADVERAAAVILAALGGDLAWAAVKHAHYRKLWRHMAHARVSAGRFGVRMAEVHCGVLQSAARWLQQEDWIAPGDALPAPAWKQQMVREWEEITSTPHRPPAKHRYTEAELAALWSALARADERLWLAMEIGAELRLGQVERVRRSDVRDYNGAPVGVVVVRGRGKKLGETVVLTPEQRGAIYYALHHGYLREMESARAAGEIADYYLVTGGRLREWGGGRRMEAGAVAQVKHADTHLDRSALRKLWQALERDAGVKHIPGRGWYGVRRVQTDRAEDVESDARVLNSLGGWSKTSTRESYQERGRMKDKERAAETRRKIRPGRESDHETEA